MRGSTTSDRFRRLHDRREFTGPAGDRQRSSSSGSSGACHSIGRWPQGPQCAASHGRLARHPGHRTARRGRTSPVPRAESRAVGEVRQRAAIRDVFLHADRNSPFACSAPSTYAVHQHLAVLRRSHELATFGYIELNDNSPRGRNRLGERECELGRCWATVSPPPALPPISQTLARAARRPQALPSTA